MIRKIQRLLLKLKKSIHVSFEISIALKGVNGLFEIIGGSLLLFIPPEKISNFLQLITYRELLQDPNDRIANYLLNIAHTLSVGSKLFAALFLLSHGVIKLFLILALLKKKHWAYPTAIIVFILFSVYQLYRYILFGNSNMLIILILDVIMIILTWLEYEEIRITAEKEKFVNSTG